MFTTNPFAELAATISPYIMQGYVIAMVLLVVGGTLLDVIHKGSARYFFANWRDGRKNAERDVGGGKMIGIAVKTAVVDVAASGEFCNANRRISHLLGMYGFIAYVVATIVMVFSYAAPGAATPVIWPVLWHIGALMICVGGYWFWFFIRVDVAAEGSSPFNLVRADMFILSLLASATFGLIWSFLQSVAGGVLAGIFLGLYLIATTVLFAGIPWSKFSHMFFKPAAAFQKRVSKADGSADNLPLLTRDDPAQRERHSMGLLKDAPMDMGLGIEREEPRHY